MHINLQDVEEMKQSLVEKELEEKQRAILEISLLEGEYKNQNQLLEDEFDSRADQGTWPAVGAVAIVI